MRIRWVLVAVLSVLAVANLALGHWAVGLSLIAVATSCAYLYSRRVR